MIGAFFASIYAVVAKIGGINLAVPFILGIVIVFYFYGRRLGNKLNRNLF